MMKKIIIIVTVLFATQYCYAQASPTEMEKRMKAAQQEMEKMKKDPKYRDIMKNMPNMDSVKKKMPKDAIAGVPKAVSVIFVFD